MQKTYKTVLASITIFIILHFWQSIPNLTIMRLLNSNEQIVIQGKTIL